MSTTTIRKSPVPRGGTPEPASATGSARPRSSTPTSSSSSGSAPSRTRSVRQSASISARGAARQSPLSNAGSGTGGGSSAAASQADEDARAEAAARIQDLQTRLAAAEAEKAQASKQTDVLQTRLDEATREAARLEEKAHEGEEQIEALRLEKREISKQMREMEAVYEAERSSMNKEKEEMVNREEELQAVIQRLKDSLAQRHNNNNNNTPLAEDEARSSRQHGTNSPSLNGDSSFAPPSSLDRSDSRNNSKLLLHKDKVIESLRLELAEAQIKLVEAENKDGGRLQELERLLLDAKRANARLVEGNEIYMLQLKDRMLNGGDFGFVDRGMNQDALDALEGRTGSGHDNNNNNVSINSSSMYSERGEGGAANSSLADELSDATEIEMGHYRRLETELKSSQEAHKALLVYTHNLIERVLENPDFEHIFDQSKGGLPKLPNVNKDLPPPPSSSSSSSSAALASIPSLLQRAKGITSGAKNGAVSSPAAGVGAGVGAGANVGAGAGIAAGAKIRPRPMSFIPAQNNNSAHTDPERAPSIPIGNLGRAASVRRGRPMSEQYTSSGAASLVSQMYHGGNGPASPPLGPARAQTFFSPGSIGNPNAAARHPSGHAYSSSGGGHSVSGNFPGMRSSDASSTTSGESGDIATIVSSPAQSPLRAPSERSTSTSTSTTFSGNKPRPLRLVQENSDAAKAAEANKRVSWMPWAWGSNATTKKDDLAGPPIRG